ncbi:MAG: hypothetical protein WKF85_11945 [Chitinophagaceae bacterium]
MDATTFNTNFPLYGAFKSNDPDHQLMATQFLNSMSRTLSGYNTNLDSVAVRAMVLGGLYETDYWKTLSDTTVLRPKKFGRT